MSLSTPGIGSGLDIKAMVDAYVKAEITPLQINHDKQLTNATTELSAVGQLKGYLSGLQSSLTNLSDLTQFYSMKYSLSEQGYLSTTLTPQAAKGTYQIEIQKLAQQHTLASDYLTNTGSGTITINFGTYNADKTAFTANTSATPVTITIPPGSDSIASVRDAINNQNSGVVASIVQDGQGSRLTITSSQTGENYAMKISGTVTSLNYDPTTGPNSVIESVAAQNSLVKINGLTLIQSTNKLDNAIAGTTLNLTQAQTGKTITLKIDENKDQVTALLNDFIKKYNDSMTFLTNLTGYNSATKQGGIFQGDPQFRSLKLNLNKVATTALPNNTSAIKSLADVGITTNKDGLLELDKTKYDKAVSSNYQDIGALFAKTATSTDPNIRIQSLSGKVKAGTYSVSLTEYTPGVSMEGSIGGFHASSADGLILRGSGVLSGLSLNVLSGSTGARGEVIVKDGMASQLNSFLDTYMSTSGDLALRTTKINKSVAQLAKAQTAIDLRSDTISRRYTRQFNALDTLLAQLQSTSSALSQQLNALPVNKN